MTSRRRTIVSGPASGDARDGSVFRPYDHGRHHQDLRVRQDADSGDEPGDQEEPEPAGRIDTVAPYAGVDDLPNRSKRFESDSSALGRFCRIR